MRAVPETPDQAADTGSIAARTVWLRRLGVIVGIALIAAAIIMLARQRQTVVEALAHVEQISSGKRFLLCGVILGTVVVNIALTGAMFSGLIARYGKVGLIEMQALIASSTLLNFLPLRAGLLGRVAYHRAYNAIPVRHSARAVLHAVLLSVMSALYLTGAIAIALQLNISLLPLALAPLPALAILAITWRRGRLGCAAALIRYADLMVSAIRYSATFALIGSPIDAKGALAFACVSSVTTMIPFLSNGLGLREWAIGIVTPLITANPVALGVTADLVNRAAEIIVALPAGLIGLAILARLRSARG
jgi:hypothetical protein